MRKTFILFFSLFSFAVLSQTKSKIENTIDGIELKCLKKKDISNVEMCNCTINAREAWDKELNKYYTLIKTKLPKQAFEVLKESQKQWIKYRDKEFAFISNYYFEVKEGTMWYAVAENKKKEIVKTRAIDLIEYYEIVAY
jgi:uncharacterized protein YecT (DUF1311 family)